MSGKLRVLDLFSGIGGFSLGLERTGGFETVAFCELKPRARAVLAKHWPDVPCFEDVTTLRGADVGTVDVICGGFPCQDISLAGLGAGLDGARSGLWSEYARLIGELRPRYVIVENVAALLSRGLDRVLRDLAALGYDAEWHCIPACAVGAPHRRDRLWIVAYAGRDGHGDLDAPREDTGASDEDQSQADQRQRVRTEPGRSGPHVADAERRGLEGGDEQRARPTAIIPAAYGRYRGGSDFGEAWRAEPDVGRVAHGVPSGMDRLEELGNAVVPQIPEIIGHAILESMRAAA